MLTLTRKWNSINTFLLVLVFYSGYGQQDTVDVTNRFSIVGYVSAGGGIYTSRIITPPESQANLSRFSPVTSFRLMWHPDHRLRLGLETGWLHFYSYKFNAADGDGGRVSLTGVPLLVVWSMQFWERLNIFFGLGGYYLTSHVYYYGNTKSSALSLGWSLSGSYVIPVNTRIGLGIEGKWLQCEETSDAVFSLQLQLVYKFFSW